MNRKGVTLVEVIVSVAVLSFGLILIIQGFIQSLGAMDTSQHNLQASHLADEALARALIESRVGVEPENEWEDKKDYGRAVYSLETRESYALDKQDLKQFVSTVSWTAGRRRGEISVYTYLTVLPHEEEKEE